MIKERRENIQNILSGDARQPKELLSKGFILFCSQSFFFKKSETNPSRIDLRHQIEITLLFKGLLFAIRHEKKTSWANLSLEKFEQSYLSGCIFLNQHPQDALSLIILLRLLQKKVIETYPQITNEEYLFATWISK